MKPKPVLDKYNKMYNARLRALTHDWKERRHAIVTNGGTPTQKQFAEMAGISENAYAKQESGASRPSRISFKKVMQAFEKYGVGA